MSPHQEDRGVELEEDEIIMSGQAQVDEEGHVLDGTGRPAKAEDDTATD